jgi:hypothetical protein
VWWEGGGVRTWAFGVNRHPAALALQQCSHLPAGCVCTGIAKCGVRKEGRGGCARGQCSFKPESSCSCAAAVQSPPCIKKRVSGKRALSDENIMVPWIRCGLISTVQPLGCIGGPAVAVPWPHNMQIGAAFCKSRCAGSRSDVMS